MDAGNSWLREKLEVSGHESQFDLMGFVTDREGLYSAADCLVVTSESEGSPNMVFEAVATGLPVIILATTGTEAISAPQVERLATRDIERLVEAMCRRSREIIPDATRALLSDAVSAVRHPMARFLERELSLE